MAWMYRTGSRCRAAIVMALAALGCDADGGRSCGQVEPCGGNLVGNWTVSGACLNNATLMRGAVEDCLTEVCPTSTISNGRYDVSGMFAFNADMTYSASLSGTVSFTWNLQNVCLQGLTCAEFDAYFQSYFQQNPDPGIQSVKCAGSNTCACTFIGAIMTTSETGTYTAAGNTLTTIASDGRTSFHDYCVQGDSLHFVDVDTTMNMGPMGQATIDTDVVAMKSR